MFEKILVALDFSPYSRKILDSIPEIPGVREVVLLHVVDATHPSRHGWTHGPQIESAKILLAERKEELEQQGMTAQIQVDVIVDVVTQGDVAQSVLDTAETSGVSLIVMGARGVNPVREILLGSVSSTVLRHVKTHVLILHSLHDPKSLAAPSSRSQTKLLGKVLLPTDFSLPAEETIRFLTTLPGISEIIFLHVISGAESSPEIEASKSEARSRLEDIRKRLAPPVPAITTRIRVGDPTEMILSVAREESVSLIAMSAHGTGWLRELLLGSTTFTVVRRAENPVLVIRTRQKS